MKSTLSNACLTLLPPFNNDIVQYYMYRLAYAVSTNRVVSKVGV